MLADGNWLTTFHDFRASSPVWSEPSLSRSLGGSGHRALSSWEAGRDC